MPFCSKCGTEVLESNNFCPKCGDTINTGKMKTENVATREESNSTGNVFQEYQKKTVGEISDKWVWTLACIPILGMILVGIVSSTTGSDLELGGTAIFIILNITFCTLDIKELKNKGYYPEGWLYLGFLLVPLYLFIRASKTNKKYGYAITWCVLFVLSCLL